MEALVTRIKRLFCKHEFVTITNFYGDMINQVSGAGKTIRSVQECTKCGKRRASTSLDKKCHIINCNIYYKDGNFRDMRWIDE